MTKINLRFYLGFLFKVFLFYILICVKSYSDNLITLGNNDAKVKIKIFSSHTCPHCASFHINVVPKIKKEYVDTGAVQLIFIDFPLDQAAFNASKLLHCIEPKNQMSFLDSIYKKQNDWTSGADISKINENLKIIAETFGVNQLEFNECLNNNVVSDKILNDRIEGQKKYSISSTPTIVINEKKLEDSLNFKNIKKKIEKLI
jgi:protein-disulfide isomerase